MSTTYRRRRLSESKREQRRTAERERVKEAAEQLLTSEGWQRWVRARSMFRRYSAHNTMLLALDFHLRGIEPEPVAGFRVWLKLGRCVRKGEHGIRIAARVTPKKAKPGAEQTEPQLDNRPVRFTTVSVFDRLSRVRSGDVADARAGLGFQPGSRCCSSARRGMRERTGFRLARSSPSRRPEGDGAAAIARASRRYPREQRPDKQARMPTPCFQAGNLADHCFHRPPQGAAALHQEGARALGVRRDRSDAE